MKPNRPSSIGFFFLLALIGTACTPPKVVTRPVPTIKSSQLIKLSPKQYPSLLDDSDSVPLQQAVTESLNYVKQLPESQVWGFVNDVYTRQEMVDSFEYFLHLLRRTDLKPEERTALFHQDFQVYQSAGTDADRTVVFSSYYEPTVSARIDGNPMYQYPFYGRPEDLTDVDLSAFDPERFHGITIWGRLAGQSLVPYYTREDIDSRKALAGNGYEIAWAKDPMDVFFMQIEGSGWLDLGNGEKVRIRYAANNGHKYKSVGQHLIKVGRAPKEGFSHASFHAYMNSHPDERQNLLNVNPRYIFFRLDRSTASVGAHGNIGVPLTPGRSIATDPKLFPKGMLAWINTTQSAFNDQGKVVGTKPLVRFAVNQDEGGGIQGPGRVDFFAGEDERFATHFWQKGQLYFIVKKKKE